MAELTKEQVRELWIERLESGTVHQVKGHLGSTNGGRCCLGVLCDLAVEHGVIPAPLDCANRYLAYLNATQLLPSVVQDWAGLRDEAGTSADRRTNSGLVNLNDGGLTFGQIAAVLRAVPSNYFLPIVALCLALACGGRAIAQPPGWLTRSYDNARSGWNPNETVLTQAAVAGRGLVRQTTIPVLGDARGMEAQPLILPGVRMAKDGSLHDVMVLPSMADIVRAVDAETGAGLWTTALGTPVTGSGRIDMHRINQHFGCLSTGVIDAATERLYQVCWVSPDGSGAPETAAYRMFTLDLRDGSLAAPPVPVQGSDRTMWKQRSSLVLTNVGGIRTIFFAHGSVFETAAGMTGGITAFDPYANVVMAQLPMSSGIWMGGQGLVADSAGALYAITANGDFEPTAGLYGESFIKVQHWLPVSGPAVMQQLKVTDAWSPWTDYQRVGKPDPAAANSTPKLSGMSMPTEAARPVGGGMSMPMAQAKVEAAMNELGQPVARVYPMAAGAWSDEDWGSAGPACVMALRICVAAGKDGIGYPIRMDALGGTTVATAGTAANYAKLAGPCAWLTMSPGPVPCAPADPRALNFFPNGVTAHLHATPVQMYDPLLKSWVLFVWGENAQLHKWALSPAGALKYIAESHEYASADVRGTPPGGMPGGFCSGSSAPPAQLISAGALSVVYGNTATPVPTSFVDPGTMLLVCSVPYGDANATVTNGRLLVYDPVHLAPDGSLKVLWDSQRFGLPYVFNKFMPPVIWNGRIYLPNYNGGVDVFALTPQGGKP